MGVYRISELAERSGFSASTLRFYERAGLVVPDERTPGGYRIYDEAAVERLRFIAGAKQLGLPLEEIRDLLTVWERGSCAPVQERLRPLLEAKINQVEERIAELTAFYGQLVQARSDLDAHTPDGPCDESCGCITPSANSAPSAVSGTAGRMSLPVVQTAPAAGCTPAITIAVSAPAEARP